MNSLSTYIKQRLNISLWSLLAVMLIALSLKDFSISLVQFYSLPFVIFFLFIMRLFDDLASAEIDKGKENRSYTTITTKKELQKYLVTAQLILLSTLAIFDIKRAMYLLAFFILNHFLYYVLFDISKFRYFLPLLKYPFIIFLLSLKLSYILVLVYCAVVLFEIMTDKTILK